jgi:ribosomal protection tetracycline resistance protein
LASLNLGILAHVDAGKTTLTERLLHAAGVIDDVGRVDDGTTRTDSLALERRRGITIKSAVVSFVVDGVTVNLVDTPGHPDFIAEVERVLGVLDGAVLVVSAVEGVQPQTVVLSRALRRLRIPTLVFVNKIDRVGADTRRTLDAVERRLGVDVLAMAEAFEVGTSAAHVRVHDLADTGFGLAASERLAEHDDVILQRYLDHGPLPPGDLAAAIATQTARGQVTPAFVGAALAGIGVDELLRAVPALLPVAPVSTTGPASGTVFKVARGPNGEKLALVRIFAGTLRTRDRVRLDGGAPSVGTVTAIDVFEHATTRRRAATHAGDIATLHGLSSARIGDTFGRAARALTHRTFARPSLETAVIARDRRDQRAVFEALTDLAEQDPLIDLRQDDNRHELYLSLYGEVQKEIVAQTLHDEHGLEIEFRPTTPVCIERPNRAATALEPLPRHRSPAHPLLAGVGLTISPLPPGSGITFELDVAIRSIPIHVFDRAETFRDLVRRTVDDTLRQGLHGWQVTDCAVVMTHCDYQAPPRKWPGTTSSDYRLLTPLVLMTALRRAGTTVFEPHVDIRLELPATGLGPTLAVLRELDAVPDRPTTDGSTVVLTGTIRAALLHHLQARLGDLTSGEGVLETTAGGHRAIDAMPPTRPRTGPDPRDRDGYLRQISRTA